MAIKASINVKYDYTNQNLINDYYATTSHSEFVRGILNGITGKSSIKSHIAYGPYGSGKSMIASILLGMLTKNYNNSTIKKVITKYSHVDNEISNILNVDLKQAHQYLPIMLNGFEGDFSVTLTNAINRCLKDSNIQDIVIPGISSEIIFTIEKWKKDYSESYQKFVDLLKNKNISVNDFYNNINVADKDAISLFIDIHKYITSGSEFIVRNKLNPTELLEEVCKKLEPKKMGICIVYDEFGRYLQSLDPDKLNVFMQELQNIAELANNGLVNLCVIFIAHKPIGHYFSALSKEMRSEFSKVEKRFGIYEIKSDYTTFFNITTKYIKDLGNNTVSKYDDLFIANTRKYNVFSGLISDTELQSVIIEGLYPLHPISVFLLPKISSVFGQNERTLFTFLNDPSENGLLGHIKNNPDFYYPYRLVDYFFYKIDKSYIEDSPEYTIYRRNITKITSLISKKNIINAEKVYKFLLVWKLTKGTTIYKLSNKFIAYSVGISEKEIDIVLDELANNKLLRYHSIHNQWEIFEGSSLKLDKAIKETIISNKTTDEYLVSLFNLMNPHRYIYANQHNSKYEITRFAELIFVLTADELSKNFGSSDLKIFFGFNDTDLVSIDRVNNFDVPFFKIKSLLEKIHAIDMLSKSHSYLLNYPNLDVELDYELSKVKKELFKIYDIIFNGKHKIIIGKETVRLSNVEQLQDSISIYFDSIYSRGLIIPNDQVNMFEITRIQTNAIVSVLEQMLISGTVQLDNIFNGSKPADLIYFTIIKNLGRVKENQYHIDELNGRILNMLNENPTGSLQDLLFLGCQPPFGLRPNVSILLVFTLIIDKWKDILLFLNNSFIPSIDTNTLYELLFSKKYNLQYVYSKFDNSNREYLEKLEGLFKDSSDGVKNKSLSIRVCSGLYNWYLELPVITQQYEGLGFMEVKFLKIVAYSRINPEQAITDLIQFMPDFNDVLLCKHSIENSFARYITKIEKEILVELGIYNLTDWVNNLDEINKKTNRIAKAVLEGKGIINEYSDNVENLEIKRWTKSSFSTFKKLVIDDNQIHNKDIKYDKIIINGKEKAVQNIDLSNKAILMYENIDNLIQATKRYITYPEIEKLMLQLVEKYIK